MGDLLALGHSKFDWYAASVPDVDDRRLAAWIGRHLERTYDGSVTVEHGKGLNSFADRLTWRDADDRKAPQLAMLQWGGQPKHPHVTVSGWRTPEFVTPFRAAFPRHRVSRVDVALDMRGEGLFAQVWAVLADISARNTRLVGRREEHDDPDRGNSYYLGAPSSSWQLCGYEKAKERFAKTGDSSWKLFWDLVRLESRFWPEKVMKDRAAVMAPAEFWGCSPTLREVARRCLALEPEHVSMKESRTADHERAMAWIADQGGATLLRELERVGGDLDAWATSILDRVMEAQSRRERGRVLHASSTTSGVVAH